MARKTTIVLENGKRICSVCGTEKVLKGSGKDAGYRCSKCLAEHNSNRTEQSNINKKILVEENGGGCNKCGYNRCYNSLDFHHINPSEKKFELNGRNLSWQLGVLKEETEKCIVLCKNCHTEIHDSKMKTETPEELWTLKSKAKTKKNWLSKVKYFFTSLV